MEMPLDQVIPDESIYQTILTEKRLIKLIHLIENRSWGKLKFTEMNGYYFVEHVDQDNNIAEWFYLYYDEFYKKYSTSLRLIYTNPGMEHLHLYNSISDNLIYFNELNEIPNGFDYYFSRVELYWVVIGHGMNLNTKINTLFVEIDENSCYDVASRVNAKAVIIKPRLSRDFIINSEYCMFTDPSISKGRFYNRARHMVKKYPSLRYFIFFEFNFINVRLDPYDCITNNFIVTIYDIIKKEYNKMSFLELVLILKKIRSYFFIR